MTFSTDASRPLSIAVGDFNNDTQLDIAVVNYGTSSIGILLGVNNGTFATSMEYFTGYDSDPRSLAVGDFNNDDLQDIAVANFGTNNIGVFLGYGNGSFQSQNIYSTGSHSHPYAITTADINRDNRLDIVVTNAGKDNVGIFLGYGNGTFVNQITFSTGNGSNPHSLVVAYLNNDIFPDIAVANSGTDNVGILIGYGNGTFASVKTYLTGYGSSPQFVTVGDFNNDNRTDIIVANNGSDNVGVIFSDRSIDFLDEISYSAGLDSSVMSMVLGDLNNDNYLDVVVANYNTDSVGILLGFSNGTFSSQTTFPTGSGSGPYSVAVSDLNHDNHMDIVVANYDTDSVGILLGFSNGTFSSQTTFPTGSGSGPTSVTVSDLNHDNHMDIVVANYDTDSVGILLGFGNGTFARQTTFPTGSGSSPISVAIADFNNDSQPDIAVANYHGHNIGILLGYDNGTFASQITYSTGELSYPACVTVGDLNNDFIMDIIAPAKYRDYVAFFFGIGNGSFGSRISYYTGYQSAPVSVVVGDLNNDNLSDIVVGNSNANYLSIFRGYGNGIFSSLVMYPIKSTDTENFVAIGDLNRDARLDIIITNYYGNCVVLLGYDAGTFASLIDFPTSYDLLPTSLTIGDFNRDHRMDIGVSNFVSNNLDIFYGHENGSFINEHTFSVGDKSHPRMIISGDLNNDNILDIAVANTGNDNIGMLIGYGNGSFRSIQTYSTGSGSKPYTLAIGDFNNDNRIDFAVANYGVGNVGVFLGFDIGAYTALPVLVLYSTSSEKNLQYLAIADFNNDNRSDIVFVERYTNIVGIILQYSNGTFASPIIYSTGSLSSPRWVTVGDVNNDNHLDIVVANSGTNNIGIFLGYGNGTFASQMTFSNNGFSPFSVTLSDFNHDNQLDIVVINSAANNICVFLGSNNRTFVSSTTYSTGSGSTPYSLAAGDFNNDNHLDIVVANSGTNNIGVFLGYGNGTLTSQITYSTDPGTSPCSVAVGDFNNDNQLDIVVITNDDGSVVIYLGYGNGTFARPTFFDTGSGAQLVFVAVGNLNNDNHLDIAVAAAFHNVIYVLFGYGNGAYTYKMPFASGHFYNPQQVVFSDFNGDGRLDCAVFDYFRIYVFFGSVNEGYLDMVPFSTGANSSPRSVSIDDLNNDNRLDIVVANSDSDNIGVFLGLGFGDFANQTTFSTGNASKPYYVALGDFNNDNRTDIAVANYGIGNIGIFLGYGNGNFTSQVTYATDPTSDPYSVVVGDVNNDTRQDIVATNFYSNYLVILFGVGDGTFVNKTIIPMGYGSLPSFVALGDVNNDYILDIAVTNYG
ncbi:unnamed protein product, partial [Rotaria sp. Silwood2]